MSEKLKKIIKKRLEKMIEEDEELQLEDIKEDGKYKVMMSDLKNIKELRNEAFKLKTDVEKFLVEKVMDNIENKKLKELVNKYPVLILLNLFKSNLSLES